MQAPESVVIILASLLVCGQLAPAAAPPQPEAVSPPVSTGVAATAPRGPQTSDVNAAIATQAEHLAEVLMLLQRWHKGLDERLTTASEPTYRHALDELQHRRELPEAGGDNPAPSPDETQSQTRTAALIMSQQERIRKLNRGIEEWERGLVIDVNQRFESVKARAEAFTEERRYRREYQELITELNRYAIDLVLGQQLRLREEFSRLDTLITLLTAAAAAPAGAAADAGAPAVTSLDAVEFYEVKAKTSLRQISAMPEVYGNADMWQTLYRANREKIIDPNSDIPPGTILLVPHVETTREFKF